MRLILVVLLFGAQVALATEDEARRTPAAVDEVSVVLANDGIVRLAGVHVPPAQARAARAALTRALFRAENALSLTREPTLDRYGRRVAPVGALAGRSLAGLLVGRGFALVHPVAGSALEHGPLITAEHRARQARRGVWGGPEPPFADARAADRLVGRFAVVEGRVLEVGSTDHHVYLNFGPDWRSDFTIRIRQKELDQVVERWGADAVELVGRRIRARGFLIRSGGPLIEVSHPEQIEVLS